MKPLNRTRKGNNIVSTFFPDFKSTSGDFSSRLDNTTHLKLVGVELDFSLIGQPQFRIEKMPNLKILELQIKYTREWSSLVNGVGTITSRSFR